MGVYDWLPNGSQVKCWKCRMEQLDVDSKVGKLVGEKNYIVLLREGGYVKVINKKISKISSHRKKKDPKDFKLPVFDKYGEMLFSKEDMHGLLPNESYYYCERIYD